MDEMRVFLCIAFGFGVVLESMLLVGLGEEGLVPTVLTSLAIAVPTSVFFYLYAAELGLHTHVLICFVIFLFFFGLMLKKKILPVVNEKTLLVLNIALWYVFLIHYPSFSSTLNFIICLILVPMTVATLVMAFIDHVVGPALTLVFYVWFLVMIVFLGLAQFPVWNLALFFDQLGPSPTGLMDVLLTGMLFSYIATNAIFVVVLIPYPWSEDQAFEERWEEVKDHAKTLIKKFSHDQLKPKESSLIILVLGGLLMLNLCLELIPDHLAINTLIVIVPQIISRRFRTAAQSEEERLQKALFD